MTPSFNSELQPMIWNTSNQCRAFHHNFNSLFRLSKQTDPNPA
jgi:hypothetical protein